MIRAAAHRVRIAVLVAVVASLGTVDVAAAEPLEPRSPEALEHLRRGNRLLELDKYDEAIAQYEAGALIEPAGGVWLGNIALAHRRAGRYQQAIDFYRRFLARIERNPDAAYMRPEIEKLIAGLEAAISQPPTEPEPRPGNGSAPADAMPPVNGARTGADPASATVHRGRPSRLNDPIAIGLAAAAVVAGGVSAGFYLSASSLRDQSDREIDQVESQRLRDRADGRGTVGAVALVVAAGLAVAAGVKFALAPDGDPVPSAASGWRMAPGPGEAGLALEVGW